jgi:hypothetical protein
MSGTTSMTTLTRVAKLDMLGERFHENLLPSPECLTHGRILDEASRAQGFTAWGGYRGLRVPAVSPRSRNQPTTDRTSTYRVKRKPAQPEAAPLFGLARASFLAYRSTG